MLMNEKCPNASDRDLAGICTVGPMYCQGCVESAKRVADGMIAHRDDKVQQLLLQIGEWQALVGTIRGLTGCPVRNVCDLTPEQHSHEMMEPFEKLHRELKAANRLIERYQKLLRRCFDAISQDGWPDLSLEVLAASKGDFAEKRNHEHIFDSYNNTDPNEMRVICRECGFIKAQ